MVLSFFVFHGFADLSVKIGRFFIWTVWNKERFDSFPVHKAMPEAVRWQQIQHKMEVPIINSTIDYSRFRFHEQNRPVGSNKRITKSIKDIDLTPYVPILVDHDYYIIDGQNRYEACKSLGKPIYYIILPESYPTNDSIIALNQNQKAWRQEEFLHFHAKTKGGCYKELEDFVKQHKFGLSNAVLIYPERAINATTIRMGITQFTKSNIADALADYLEQDNIKMLKFCNTRPFVLAIKKAFEIYSARDLRRLYSKILIVPKCADFTQYLNVFKNILKK